MQHVVPPSLTGSAAKFLSIVVACILAASPAVADLPSEDEVRQAIAALPDRLHAAEMSAIGSFWIASEDSSHKGSVSRQHYELAFEDGLSKIRYRRANSPDADEDQLWIWNGDILHLRLRNIGMDTGKVRKATVANRQVEIHPFLPWVDMAIRFRFSPQETDFTIEGEEVWRGMRTVKIAWDLGDSHNTALLSLDHGLMPVLIEDRRDGAVRRSVEVGSLWQGPGGAAMPTEVTTRYFDTRQLRKIYSGDRLPDVDKDEPLVYMKHYDISVVSINEDLDDELFEMEWGFGTEIIDEITGLRMYYGQDAYEAEQAALETFNVLIDAEAAAHDAGSAAAALETSLDDTSVEAAQQREAAAPPASQAAVDAQAASSEPAGSRPWLIATAAGGALAVLVLALVYFRKAKSMRRDGVT